MLCKCVATHLHSIDHTPHSYIGMIRRVYVVCAASSPKGTGDRRASSVLFDTLLHSIVSGPVAAWPGGPGGAPTHLPLYDVGRHGHRRAPGVRSMYYQALALDQSSDVIVINLD